MALHWDVTAGRFRDRVTGRFVAETQVRAGVDRIAEDASAKARALSVALREERLSLAEWQVEMIRNVRVSSTATAMMAGGGERQMTTGDWSFVGRQILAQAEYLDNFAAQIHSGAQALNGGLDARAAQYGQQARVVFENMRRRERKRAGMTQESNVLHPAEHCDSCREQTARGWVEIGTLVPVGKRTCRGNCKCTISYRAGQ